MTTSTYPSDDDRAALDVAHELLASRGIGPGAHAYDVTTLAAAVYDHGWSYGIDLSSGAYRAEVRPQHSHTRHPQVVGVGWTPEVALAFAIAQALRW